MYRHLVKRIIDLLAAIVALIVLSPLILLASMLLAVDHCGNPFFLQTRPGKGGKLFNIVKFKTMTDKRDSSGALLQDSERITRIGNMVRKSSFDEVPQLINVMTGDMSLIGPRPLLPEYLNLYSQEQNRRHNVRPGITGWAQVNGRNAISWTEKFRYDVWYVDNLSFSLDLKIVFMTLKKVFLRDGISSATSQTMERFTGN
jgi:undecaprenyl phosphate N,N'-diacetylbacillosamine 1-phosphate transferase